jgi:hypothetical protein
LKLILYPLAFILFLAFNAEAAVYHVKKAGSGGSASNDCTEMQTEETPALTINQALACFNPATAGSGAGHTIRIYAGTYAEAINNIIPGGTSWSNPFTIESNPGDTVVIAPTSCSALIVIDVRRTNSKFFQIKGTSTSDRMKIQAGLGTCTNDAIKFASSSSLGAPSFGRLQYLEVTGAINHGIQFTSSSGFNEIKDNWIHNNGDQVNVDDTHGMYIHSPDNLIEGNLVEDNCNRGLQIFNSGTNNAHRNIVRRNIFRENGTCETSSQVVLSSGNDIKFHDNILYSGNQHAIGVNQNNPQRTLIFNNTMYDHATSSPCINIQAGANGTRILNNICRNPSGNGSLLTDAGSNTVNTTNLSPSTNPGFVAPASADFSLAAGSAAINQGTATIATSPATITRLFNGSAPDIGAHETLPVTVATGITAIANGQQVDIGFPLNMGGDAASTRRTPMLPSTGITGFTLSDSRTVTSATRLSDSVIRLVYTGSCTGGTFSYSGGNLTDGALIGGSMNQSVLAVTTQAITNACGGDPTDPPAGGLHVHYKFNEGAGSTAMDETVNGLDGTLQNSPTWVAWQGSFALQFADGVADGVAIPYGNTVNPTTQSLSACMEIYPTVVGSALEIYFGPSLGTDQRFYIAKHTSDTFSLGIQGSAAGTNTEFPVVINTRYRVCMVANSATDTATLYVNGVKGTSSQSVKAYTSFALASNFSVGRYSSAAASLPGAVIDEFKLYTAALTDQEVLDDYNAWNPPTPGGTATFTQVAYQWHMLLKDMDGNLTKLPTSSAAVNSTIKASSGARLTVDIQVDCDDVANCVPTGHVLQYDIDGSGLWAAVPDSCVGVVCFIGTSGTSAAYPSGAPTCPLSGALTCVDGGTQRTAAAVPVSDLGQNNSTVNRYLLQTVLAVDQVLRLRLIDQNGNVLGTYSQYPTVTGRNPTAGVGM